MYEGNDKALRNELDFLHRKLEELVVVLNQHTLLLREKKDNVVVEETKQQGILTNKVKWVHFVKEYDYKDKVFEQFLITFQDESKYYMDKHKNSKPQVEDGDTISYKIDGDKLREVRVLYNTQTT
jgi:hypothetical protein